MSRGNPVGHPAGASSARPAVVRPRHGPAAHAAPASRPRPRRLLHRQPGRRPPAAPHPRAVWPTLSRAPAQQRIVQRPWQMRRRSGNRRLPNSSVAGMSASQHRCGSTGNRPGAPMPRQNPDGKDSAAPPTCPARRPPAGRPPAPAAAAHVAGRGPGPRPRRPQRSAAPSPGPGSAAQSCDQGCNGKDGHQNDQVRDQSSEDGINETCRTPGHGAGQHHGHEHHTQGQWQRAPCHGRGPEHRDHKGDHQSDAKQVGQLRKHKIDQDGVSLASCIQD